MHFDYKEVAFVRGHHQKQRKNTNRDAGKSMFPDAKAGQGETWETNSPPDFFGFGSAEVFPSVKGINQQ